MTGHEVEIAVLGPVEVRGAPFPFRRSAALELVVYLAFHRHGVSHGEWAAAIWPERSVSLSTLHATASDARRALGHERDASSRVSRGSRIALAKSVGTDVERFTARAESDDPLCLRDALALVRGPLFAGLGRADWAVFDGTRSHIEAAVVDVALRGASVCIERGRGDVAEWMVRKALVVSPYDERLYRGLLMAVTAQGDRARLSPTMEQLLTLAGEGGGSVGRGSGSSRAPVPPGVECLHPQTASLYRDLLGSRRAAGGRPARL